jgi:hypothetical protein
MHVSRMNSTPALKQSYPYEPPIRDENNFLWIETLVSDFLNWTLNAHPTQSPANMQMIARLFGEVWRHQFSQPTSLCAGAASLQSLLALSVKSGELLNLNQQVEQELRIFFLSRQHDPLTVRITQTEFVSMRRFLIDQMIILFDSPANALTAPALPPEPPANDAQLPPS